MRAIVAALCLLAVTGCFDERPTAPGPVDQTIVLAPGQSAVVPGTSITLTFSGVTGDSRCPADALCIQGGSATVRVDAAARSGGRQIVTFETGNLQPASYGGFRMELTQLAPYPFSAGPIKHDDYRATLRITR